MIALYEMSELQRAVRRSRLFPGVACKITELPDRTVISVDPDAIWTHPWTIACRFESDPSKPDNFIWFAYVQPGFVNGEDVAIGSLANGKSQFIALTDEQPAGLKLVFRNPLKGGAYPAIFRALNVRPVRDSDGNATTPASPNADREIRACDVVLTVPRYSTKQTVNVNDPLATATILSISTVIDGSLIESTTDAPYRLGTFAEWTKPQEPSQVERLLGTAQEPETDQILIATIWFISAPGADETDEPDQTWQPFSQYFVFWNLCYDQKNDVTTVQSTPLQFHTLLAAGVGDSIIQGLLAPINDDLNALNQLLEQTDLSGKFWSI